SKHCQRVSEAVSGHAQARRRPWPRTSSPLASARGRNLGRPSVPVHETTVTRFRERWAKIPGQQADPTGQWMIQDLGSSMPAGEARKRMSVVGYAVDRAGSGNLVRFKKPIT